MQRSITLFTQTRIFSIILSKKKNRKCIRQKVRLCYSCYLLFAQASLVVYAVICHRLLFTYRYTRIRTEMEEQQKRIKLWMKINLFFLNSSLLFAFRWNFSIPAAFSGCSSWRMLKCELRKTMKLSDPTSATLRV